MSECRRAVWATPARVCRLESLARKPAWQAGKLAPRRLASTSLRLCVSASIGSVSRYNSSTMPEFDVVGVGLNATDTLLIVPHFPAYAGKVPFEQEILSSGRTGGQRHGGVRAAGAAHQIHRRRGGRRARAHPDGKPAGHGHQPGPRADCGGDAPTSRRTSLSTSRRASGRCCGGATNACASTRTRSRDEQIACARLLHIDGHDTPAVAQAAGIARAPRHSGDGGRRYDLPRVRPGAAEHRLPGGQLGISGGVDGGRTIRSGRWKRFRTSTA